MTVSADANGGAGVDIVGDVTFAGKLQIGTSATGAHMQITENLITGFYADGSMAFRIGVVS